MRDRVDRLLDPGSPFLELSPLAAYDMDGGDINSAGIVTGIGRVDGRQVPLGAPLFHVEPAAEDDSATPSATG